MPLHTKGGERQSYNENGTEQRSATQQNSQAIAFQRQGDQWGTSHCSRAPRKIELIQQGRALRSSQSRNRQICSRSGQSIAQAERCGSRQSDSVRVRVQARKTAAHQRIT